MRRRDFGHSLGLVLSRLFRRPQARGLELLPGLQQAHRMMMLGDYAGAVALFEQLAGQTEPSPGRRAPFLFLQAGRARTLTGEFGAGMQQFKHGLSMLAGTQRYNQLYRAATRISQELKARGLDREAQEISALVRTHTPAIAELATERMPETRSALPPYCPSCGGPMRPDEVEWIDETTAECAFCGSPVRSES